MTNPFLALEETQTPAAVKARKRGAEKAAATRAAKRTEDDAENEHLAKLYREHRRAQKEALLSGSHGAEIRHLLNWSARMTLSDAPQLIDRVRQAMIWIEDLDVDARFVLLRLLNNAIVNLRVREGLAPLDDGLWDERAKAFFVIKTTMGLEGK
jgi:hypothetical protein